MHNNILLTYLNMDMHRMIYSIVNPTAFEHKSFNLFIY